MKQRSLLPFIVLALLLLTACGNPPQADFEVTVTNDSIGNGPISSILDTIDTNNDENSNTPSQETDESDASNQNDQPPTSADLYNQISTAIHTASKVSWNWFWDPTEIDRTDTFSQYYEQYPTNYYAVSVDGISNKEDLRNYMHQYFNYETIDEMMTYHDWLERDGKLYVSETLGLGGMAPSMLYITFTTVADSEYRITIFEDYGNTYEIDTVHYLLEDGNWVFDGILSYMGETVPIEQLTSAQYEELVTEYYSYNATYTENIYQPETQTSTPTEITRSYQIPQIRISNPDISAINAEIYENLYSITQSVSSEISMFAHPETSSGISYSWFVNENVLSLVIKNEAWPNRTPQDEYWVYNVSLSDGSILSNKDLLEIVGFSESQFIERAEQALGSCFHEKYGGTFTNENTVAFFDEQLFDTLASDNILQSKLYFNNKNELHMIAMLHSLAGADYYWTDLNLFDFIFYPNYNEPAVLNATEQSSSSAQISITELLGDWTIDTEYTHINSNKSLFDLYGSSVSDSTPKMNFGFDGSFEYTVGWCYGKGSYILHESAITVTLDEGDPPFTNGFTIQICSEEGIDRLAMDQYENGTLVFWQKE